MLAIEGNEIKWRCGACKKWNKIERDKCGSCKTPIDDADAYKMVNELSRSEEYFYKHSVPKLLMEIGEIKAHLGEIKAYLRERLEVLKEEKEQ